MKLLTSSAVRLGILHQSDQSTIVVIVNLASTDVVESSILNPLPLLNDPHQILTFP